MLDRLSPRSIFRGVLDGLKKRSRNENEKNDVWARLILFGVPVLVAGAVIATQTIVDKAEVALAAAALLVGALLAGFSQVASWRERVLARSTNRNSVRVRALNEAGALILFSIHVSVIASVAVFIVTLVGTPEPGTAARWFVVILGSVGPAALAYVALSLVFVANLLWDAFVNDQEDVEQENLPEFDSGTPSGR